MSKVYHPTEEKLNVITHGLGFILSLIALVFLITYSSLEGTVWHVVSFTIYGISLSTLYLASTLYHSAKKPIKRLKLRTFDHAAIYLLIAGSYTPFALVTLKGTSGWIVFGLIWGFAVIGIIFKLFHTGKYSLLSTISYVAMGSVALIAIKPLIANLSENGLNWLLAGGIAYLIGALLYSFKRIPFNHAIFHIFVLAGSFCHFCAVFWHVV